LNIPGLSVAIAVGNQVVYSNGFGMADLENSIPAKATTVYRTASIAKPMTAVAVMRLAEQGKLDLDAPIQKYCRAFPEKNYPVTARQLLGHLAGVRHYKARGESAGTEHFFTCRRI
jgi:CubicO group peptidase (beta-lactamase class C family)